jgi:hypothetical protein
MPYKKTQQYVSGTAWSLSERNKDEIAIAKDWTPFLKFDPNPTSENWCVQYV